MAVDQTNQRDAAEVHIAYLGSFSDAAPMQAFPVL